MKILFVSCYVNNSHFMNLTKECFTKYLKYDEYEYICLNDAPKESDKNYINICERSYSITGYYNIPFNNIFPLFLLYKQDTPYRHLNQTNSP